jgi:small GTP-binding protein
METQPLWGGSSASATRKMPDEFKYDVFLSYSAKDTEVVRPLAERLRADGLKVWFGEWVLKLGDITPAKIEEGLEHSRVLVLCMSANAFDSDWAQLESSTFRFRDPLNKGRRFIPLRLDNAPIKGSLAQFLYSDWRSAKREQEYGRLIEACRHAAELPPPEAEAASSEIRRTFIQLRAEAGIDAYAFSPDGSRVLTGCSDKIVRLWELQTGRCLRALEGHTDDVWSLAWSADQMEALSGSRDGTMRLWDLEVGKCLRVFPGQGGQILAVGWSADQRRAISGDSSGELRLWNVETGLCLRVLEGHKSDVRSVAWSADQKLALSGSHDKTLRLWEVATGHCLRVIEGHTDAVRSIEWSADQSLALTGSNDMTIRLWEVETGRCLRVLEGHFGFIRSVAWGTDQRLALSCSADRTVRLWNVQTGRCLHIVRTLTESLRTVAWSADGRRAYSGDENGGIRIWDLSEFVARTRAPEVVTPALPSARNQVQYTNAKVLLVGDTHSGKTGLAHRLATGAWKPSDTSTVGAWSTQWKLSGEPSEPGLEREIWLWDFGGQADQRLIHQLYLDHAALILLLFDADQEEVLPGLRGWRTALRRCVPEGSPQILVAGRVDAGFKASRSKLQAFAQEEKLAYHETSALTAEGCDGLRAAILSGIPWANIPITTTEHQFKVIKDEILKLRDEGQVLHTFKELRDLLWRRLPDEPRFTDPTLKTVIGLLDGPGVVKELDYGTYILLQPEWINAYAQAVIRTLRSDPKELGCLPLRTIAEGKLLYQSVGRDGVPTEMKRLPPPEERTVLGEMERQLMDRGLCLRQGDKLVFPSHCGRDRPKVVEHPSVFVSYAVHGYLDDLYATLVVKLADSQAFKLMELWRDAADFDTLEGGHRMGLKLTRDTASIGEISVYFGPGVTQEQQVIFANYIHGHLEAGSEQVRRLRHYVCPKCHTPKGNPQVLMEKLLAKKQ